MTTSHFQRNACIERMTPRVGPDRGQVLPDGKLIVSSVVHRMGNGWASPQHDAITKAEQNDLRRSIKNLLATPGAVEFRLDDDDEVIAARVGRTKSAVQAKRVVLGIEVFRQTAQRRDGGSRR